MAQCYHENFRVGKNRCEILRMNFICFEQKSRQKLIAYIAISHLQVKLREKKTKKTFILKDRRALCIADKFIAFLIHIRNIV